MMYSTNRIQSHQIRRHTGPFRSSRLAIVVAPILSITALILMWHLGSHAIPILPTPAETGQVLILMIADGTLGQSAISSARRIVIGLGIALIVAVPLGLSAGLSHTVRNLVTPIIEVLRPISAIAWIPAAILWFGVSESAAHFLIAYGVAFPILINVIAGVANVPKPFIQAATNLGASRRMMLFEVILPAAAPTIIAGIRVGIGLGIAIIVAAELGIGFTLGSGLGYLLLNYSVVAYDPTRMLAIILTIGVIGLLADRLLARGETYFVKWKY